MMDAGALLDTIRPSWRSAVAPVLGEEWFDRFIAEQRDAIVALLGRWLRGELGGRSSSQSPRRSATRETVSASPAMVAALRALRVDELERPDEQHPMPVGISDRTVQALVDKGLIEAFDNRYGGPPHYRTTPRGRAQIDMTPTPMTTEAADRWVAGVDGQIASLQRQGIETDEDREALAGLVRERAEANAARSLASAAIPDLIPLASKLGRKEIETSTDQAADFARVVEDFAAAVEAIGAAALNDMDYDVANWADAVRELAPPSLERVRDAFLAGMRSALRRRGVDADDDGPPDEWGKAQRTAANVKAMKIVADKVLPSAPPGSRGEETLTPAERRTVLTYSGWGGLSIDAVRDKLPPGFVPETFGLIHEYYTPTVVARAVADMICPLLPPLAGGRSHVRALEPSAGIGRLVRAMDRCPVPVAWTLVEFSQVSSRMLRAVYADAAHYWMPFERFVTEHADGMRGELGLVLSNPPYGDRGEFALIDQDKDYKERRAYAYFMRRSLDLLMPNGLGVFLVPAGALSGEGKEARRLREQLLLRYHLSAAFRLPSETAAGRDFVPGAGVVMDIHIWRSRGGQLAAIDPGDAYVLEGKYFEQHPAHVLGTESGPFREQGKAGNWRYSVRGDFVGLPELIERPLCSACAIGPVASRAPSRRRAEVVLPGAASEITVPDALAAMLQLGARVAAYLQARAADDAARTAALWPELHQALVDLRTTPDVVSSGGVRRHPGLREAADRGNRSAQALRNAFTDGGELVTALAERPTFTPRYAGRPDDVVAQADLLFRQRRHLTIRDLLAFHRSVGGNLDERQALERLLAASWNHDGERWDELVPLDVYTTGRTLWERYDLAQARASVGDEQARVQSARVLAAINPAGFEDIDLSPIHGYVPLPLLSQWVSETLQSRLGAVELQRSEGLVTIGSRKYSDLDQETRGVHPATLAFLGFINHDPELFKPPKEKGRGRMSAEERKQEKQDLAERRRKQVEAWTESFKSWCAADPDRREQITDAYNRVARGRVVPKYSAEPLEIARWGASSPTLKPHQVAGAKRVLENRGGLVAFDVGVGKTYTALAIVARARQEGWVRRPVILVPPSIVWKWYDDIRCTLPDYRVAVIGGNRKRNRKGILTSEEDTVEQQAQKWLALQAGQLDVVILSYTALSRIRVSEGAVMEYVRQVEAVERSINLRRRNLADKKPERLSERDRALLEHGISAWVREILTLPEGWNYVPGITWDELGVDCLVVDEAHNYKNKHMPQPRDGGVPKFMGSAGEGSNRAWQLDFRAAVVRKNTGGAGIVLLTATPATNSPLEFYNLIEYIDPAAFGNAGIHDPEQFIDTFLKIEKRDVLDSTLEIAQKPAVVGFKNLDDLRTIILTYGEFRTAEDVGLKLPEAIVERVTVQMDEEQERTYDRYVARIEELLEKPTEDTDGRSMVILGLLQRLSLVALHPSLEDGYDFKSALGGGTSRQQINEDSLEEFKAKGWSKVGAADDDGTIIIQRTLPAVDPSSPKFEAIARRIGANPQCGHIVFCEPTAAHAWLREVLVEHGIPRERIAILNAEVTKPADRTRIAKEFNGLSSEPLPAGSCAAGRDARVAPKYDVVIANSVAYEGIDLQTRTCSIHHADLPWTPAALQQRNGRGVRQGNDSPGDPRADDGAGIRAGVVKIFYYFADRSTDGYRFSLIDGKASWMADLLKSQVRDTNNPAAQQQLSPEDILLMISRNKEKTRKLLAERAERAKLDAQTKVVIEAARLLRQASGRFRDAREEADPARAERLREEGEDRLSALEALDPEAWPWAPWMYVVRETEVIPDEHSAAPLYEGLRLVLPSGFVELGRILTSNEGPVIGVRQAGVTRWDVRRPSQLGAMRPEYYPGDGQPPWPEDDDARALQDLVSRVEVMFRYSSASIDDLAWRGASDAWVARAWPRVGERVVSGLARAYNDHPVPILLGGKLTRLDVAGKSAAIAAGARALPPTLAGWRDFLSLAPASEMSFTQLRETGNYWWERKIPPTLLSAAREAEAAPRPRKGLPAVPPPPATLAGSSALPAVLPPPARGESVSPPVPLTRAQHTEAARRELAALALRPDRRAYWLGKASSAIRVGDKYHAILDQAAAEADATTSGTGGFLDAFNRAGTYRAELVREGATGKTYVVTRAFDGRPLATIVTQHPLGGGGDGDEEIENILWREPLSPQEQTAITERFLDTLLYTETGTLAAEAEAMERRARALGADPARARGPLAEIAGALAEVEEVEALQDIRPLLYWTAAMVSAPRCMGEVQDASAAAVREAYRLYQVARRRILGGAPSRAIVSSLTRVVRAAAQLAGDCGEGQVTLLGVPLQLQVAPDDRANIEGVS